MQHTENLQRTDSHTPPPPHTHIPGRRFRVECDELFLSERALWHIFFVAGDSLEELINAPDGPPAHSIGIENDGICIAGHSINLATTEPHELLITWAVAHAIFHFKFTREHATVGVKLFNHVCGFATHEPPRVAKVMKALK